MKIHVSRTTKKNFILSAYNLYFNLLFKWLWWFIFKIWYLRKSLLRQKMFKCLGTSRLWFIKAVSFDSDSVGVKSTFKWKNTFIFIFSYFKVFRLKIMSFKVFWFFEYSNSFQNALKVRWKVFRRVKSPEAYFNGLILRVFAVSKGQFLKSIDSRALVESGIGSRRPQIE